MIKLDEVFWGNTDISQIIFKLNDFIMIYGNYFSKKRLLKNANLHILVQNTWKKYIV